MKNFEETKQNYINPDVLKEKSRNFPLGLDESFTNFKQVSLNSSINSEYKPNCSINDSIAFTNIYFCEENNENLNFQKKKTSSKEKIKDLTKKLQNSEREIRRLRKKVEDVQKENAIKLQFMQEQHEKKIQKSKQDLDFLLNDLNSRSTMIIAQKFQEAHSKNIENLKSHYEKIIKNIKTGLDIASSNNVIIIVNKKNFEYLTEITNSSKTDTVCMKKEILFELIESSKDNHFTQNEYESYEEMSTLESEQGHDKNSINSLIKSQKHKSNSLSDPKSRRYSLNSLKVVKKY